MIGNAAGWQELAARAASWANIGPDKGWVTSEELRWYREGPFANLPVVVGSAAVALFAMLMARLADPPCRACLEIVATSADNGLEHTCCQFHASGGHPRDRHGLVVAEKVYGPRPWAHEQPDLDHVIDEPTGKDPRVSWVAAHDPDLHAALRRVHAGTDRGELKALLREAWGPSPAKRLDPFEAGRDAGREIARGFVEERFPQEPPLGTLESVVRDRRTVDMSDLRGLAARESATPTPQRFYCARGCGQKVRKDGDTCGPFMSNRCERAMGAARERATCVHGCGNPARTFGCCDQYISTGSCNGNT